MFETIVSKISQNLTAHTIEEAMRLRPTRFFTIDLETANEIGSKKPADCPYSDAQGIMGISLCNLTGDAVYMVIDDNRKYGGISVVEAINFLNIYWFQEAEVVSAHNLKFDFAWLLKRGLCLKPFTKLIDTWIINSIKCEGVFTSNKLKDVVKNTFKLEVSDKEAKDDFFEKNNTKDYGDLPLDLVSIYAQADTRFGMMLLLCAPQLTPEEWANHDLYVRNSMHLIEAEARGVCVDRDVLRSKLETATNDMLTYENLVKQQLGATEFDINDEQKILHYMHRQNLHPGPRDYYGENKYVFDYEAVKANEDTPLARYYGAYHAAKAFIECFSGKRGEMTYRIFSTDDGDAGFHPAHQLQIYAKGGAVQVKAPDIAARVPLDNEIRKIFAPRKNHKFVVLTAHHLMIQLLAFYCRDEELLHDLQNGGDPSILMAARINDKKFTPEACKVLWRKFIEGSGMGILLERLKAAGFRVAKREHFPACDLFKSKIANYDQMIGGVANSLQSEGFLRDRMNRRIQVPEDKRYRSEAILFNMSYGSILSVYLDVFCRVAKQTDAHLILVHGTEFLFETAKESLKFEVACREVFQRTLVTPQPVWTLETGFVWSAKE